MNALLINVQDKFARLQEREKLFIRAGGAAVFIALLYTALLPQLDRNSDLASQQTVLQADMLWLQQQQAVVSRLTNSCSSSTASAEQAKDLLTRLIRRNQLRLKNLREVGDGLVLNFTSSDANRVVRIAHQIACQGFVVDSMQVNGSGSEANLWDATMEVSYVN
jgi:type II secretory pathway component PulM